MHRSYGERDLHRGRLASHSDDDVAQKLADGAASVVGWFRYFFDDDRWEWSPEVAKMHGYEPGTVTPTTRLVLSHKHPDDYRDVADTLALIRQTGRAFRSRHRICDTHGRVHHVAVIGDEILDDDGRVIGTYGFYVDLSREEQAQQRQLSVEVAHIAERRSAIEQAKGMLRLVYNIDEAAAFELLKWRSQESNVKLQSLAQQVVDDFAGAHRDGTVPTRSEYDNLLLTAHLRIQENGAPERLPLERQSNGGPAVPSDLS